MADLNPDETAAPPTKKRLPLIVAIVVIVLGACGAAAWWFLGRSGEHEAGVDGGAPAASAAEPIYVALDPPFVVNFHASGQVRFLQIAVQAMSRDAATIELLKRHDPVIRNALLLLFAGRSYESLATREGKEALRRSALEELRKVVAAHGGDGATLEDLYFTSFVMQ
ncbi:MAG TPA: flagellar basal body-associated FliL family protein [Steroidobacteraceae bacterium]|jgi:flagellar FliL protein|nr:flagellar basal body-associated FliL family protein [Steroidobacteraceae bacterium]